MGVVETRANAIGVTLKLFDGMLFKIQVHKFDLNRTYLE